MGKKPTIFLSLIVLITFSWSCIPDPVEISIPPADSRLVIASQIAFDQVMLVQVSRSFGALEFSEEEDSLSDDFLNQILADSARVTVAYRDGTDTLFGIGNGFYVTFFTPLYENESYQLSVFDSTTEMSVIAESEVLPIVPLDSIEYNFIEASFEFNGTTFVDTALRVIVRFSDIPGENYYMLNTYELSNQTNATENIFISEGGPATRIYADQLFSDSIITDTLIYPEFSFGDTIAIALSHISEGYYNYLATRQRSGTSLFANLLQEPVNYPTNVVEGYGFFNLHLPSIRVLVLE